MRHSEKGTGLGQAEVVEGLVERDLLEGGFECGWSGTHGGEN
jgi:hypothetical protein